MDKKLSNPQQAETYDLETFKGQVRRHTDGRYVIKFPWKDNIPSNSTYEVEARRRLHSVTKSLLRKGQLKMYDKILKEYLLDDIAEEVPEGKFSNRIRYLPHHGVIKESSTSTKLRIVLDASAKAFRGDYSLNDRVRSCENLLPSLVSILLRFRENRFAITADVRKAFLQIEIDPEDRDALRYFWYRERLGEGFPESNPVSYRMKRLPFGLSVSPFVLCSVIQIHLENRVDSFPNTVRQISKNIYMDDMVVSTETIEEAREIKKRQSETIQ